ncbi:MAG TPA: HAD family phosphatase [Patescibacteria group bacterium]|nr:HAD family phosphatase [Patescibacteria group bacterium]
MIRAVIFDLDGTLVETEPLHFSAFNEVLRPDGIRIDFADYASRLIGLNDHDCFAAVLKENHQNAPEERLADLIARKSAIYQATIAERDVLYPGAEKFLRACAERFPLMIATGTLRIEAEAILRRAALRDLFLDIIAADDVEHGKPEPDGFIAALGRIGFILRQRDPVLPDECLVVEDTPAGIEAAHRAGMKVLALCHIAPPSELAAADVVRQSILELDLDDVLRELRTVDKNVGTR